jgi:isopentenyldiphosphate isomerase
MEISQQEEMFDIVDLDGNPTWEVVSRNMAHTLGLLHRVIHIHFYDIHGNIYFQKRSKDRQHFPGMLHFAIWWHVSAWISIEETISAEALEELGIHLDQSKLLFIWLFHQKVDHPQHGHCDNELCFDYIYLFDGDISQFVYSDKSVDGIEKISIADLEKLSLALYPDYNIVPYWFYPTIYERIKERI